MGGTTILPSQCQNTSSSSCSNQAGEQSRDHGWNVAEAEDSGDADAAAEAKERLDAASDQADTADAAVADASIAAAAADSGPAAQEANQQAAETAAADADKAAANADKATADAEEKVETAKQDAATLSQNADQAGAALDESEDAMAGVQEQLSQAAAKLEEAQAGAANAEAAHKKEALDKAVNAATVAAILGSAKKKAGVTGESGASTAHTPGPLIRGHDESLWNLAKGPEPHAAGVEPYAAGDADHTLVYEPARELDDGDCEWNYWRARCKDRAVCEYRYKLWDMHLSQSCRLKDGWKALQKAADADNKSNAARWRTPVSPFALALVAAALSWHCSIPK